MVVRKNQSLEELLGGFANKVLDQARKPNLNRYVPLPKQELFHQSQKKHRILFGGNRGGKTFGGIADDVMILTKRHPYRQHFYGDGPVRIRFIGVDFDRGILQGAIPLFQQLIPPSFLTDGSWERSYSKSERLLTLADKSTCSFMSYEQDPNKFQVVSLHHIHFDEEPPKPIFDESLMRLVDTNGTWTLSETPVQQLEWVQDELMTPAEDGDRDDIDIQYLDTRENTHLSNEALSEIIKGLTIEDQVVRLAGRYKAGSLVFPDFERKYPYVIPREAFVLTEEWRVSRSMDHGFANPTAWLWTASHADGSIVTFESLYGANILVEDWAKLVKAKDDEIGALLGYSPGQWQPHITVGDPGIAQRNNAVTGTTIQQEYAKHGIYIGTEGIVKSRTGNQNIGLDKMRTYQKPRPGHLVAASNGETDQPWWQVTDNNTALIDEVKKARKPRQSLQNKEIKNPSEEIRDKDNHAIDAIKYLFIITGDLRPERYRAENQQDFPDEWKRASPAPPTTHGEIFNATMAARRNAWRSYGAGDYQDLEG